MSLPTPGAVTTAAIGKGTQLWYFAGTGTPTWVQVAELLDLKMPKHKASPVEVQRYDSPSLYPELIPGWCKGDKVEATLTYNAAQGSALFAMLNTLCQWKVVKNDTNTWVYQGILTSFGDELPLKDKTMNIVEFEISGAPVPTAASA